MPKLKELGVAFRAYRLAAGESVEELALAIETESATIKEVEAGLLVPTGDMIELIARHYSLREQEARRLFELAGHKKSDFDMNLETTDIDFAQLSKDYDVLISPVFYTDKADVASNKAGIVINFVQNGPSGDKPIVISRVGMSHQQAENVIRELQASLEKMKKEEADEN